MLLQSSHEFPHSHFRGHPKSGNPLDPESTVQQGTSPPHDAIPALVNFHLCQEAESNEKRP